MKKVRATASILNNLRGLGRGGRDDLTRGALRQGEGRSGGGGQKGGASVFGSLQFGGSHRETAKEPRNKLER